MTKARFVLAGLVLVLTPACGSSPPATTAGEPSALVVVARVDRGPVDEVIESYGSVQFDPARTREITALNSTEVRQVSVVAGQMVHAGDVLLVLGSFPRDSPEVRRARISLDFAQRELDRIERLSSLGMATNGDRQKARRQLAIDRATLRSLGRDGKNDEISVMSPIDGIVAAVPVERGRLLHAGEVAVIVSAGTAMAVRTGFEIEDLPHLAAGLAVEVVPIVAADATPAQARLTPLHRVGDPATQLVQTLIPMSDPPPWMVAGIRVRVRVILDREPEALRIPRDAMTRRKDQAGVFAVVDGHARWKPVQTRVRGERFLGISGDLRPGDLVVTTGETGLADGLAVRFSITGSAG